jgi:molybdate transport system permease protein
VNAEVWQITWFTVLAALAATVLMTVPGVGIAWLLARRDFPGKSLLEVFVTLPLVIPPVATGLVLLQLFGNRGPLGSALSALGVDLIFTWKAVVLAMSVMGLPLVVRTARAGFEQVNHRYEQVAESLGAGPARVFLSITLPLAIRSVIAGAILGFSRALGEFGATIMVAGNIPGRTRTLAVAIYGYTETGQDEAAARLLLISVVLAFVALWTSNRILRHPLNSAGRV